MRRGPPQVRINRTNELGLSLGLTTGKSGHTEVLDALTTSSHQLVPLATTGSCGRAQAHQPVFPLPSTAVKLWLHSLLS